MRTLFTNAQVYSRQGVPCDALTVVDGRIEWIGSQTQAPEADSVVDCQGMWLAPAFGDGHVHLTNTGLQNTGVNLVSVSSADEVWQQLEPLSGSDIVIGHGWDDTHWSESFASSVKRWPDLPCYLSRVDVHSAAISPALVAMCPEIRSLPGWSETGVVTAAAHGLARTTAFSLLSTSTIEKLQQLTLNMALRQGVVAVDEMAGPTISGERDAQSSQLHGQLFPEVFLWWGEIQGFETARRLGAFGCGGDLFLDGSIGSKTAHVECEYLDGGVGNLYHSPDDVNHHIREGASTGLALGFHAIGDLAIEYALRGFESAPLPVQRDIHRIEHVEMISEAQLERFASLGLVASVQPVFDELWAGAEGLYQKRLGGRATTMNPFRSFARNGSLMVFGSDAPVTPIDPWRAIKAAVLTHHEAHSLNTRAAFNAHTQAFWRSHRVLDAGLIEVGQRAHLALWRVEVFEEHHGTAQQWSLDPRSMVQPLPDVRHTAPQLQALWKSGVQLV